MELKGLPEKGHIQLVMMIHLVDTFRQFTPDFPELVEGFYFVLGKVVIRQGSVYVTAGGRKYHREGCRHLRSGAVAVSLEDARARGCSPCSVCASRE